MGFKLLYNSWVIPICLLLEITDIEYTSDKDVNNSSRLRVLL